MNTIKSTLKDKKGYYSTVIFSYTKNNSVKFEGYNEVNLSPLQFKEAIQAVMQHDPDFINEILNEDTFQSRLCALEQELVTLRASSAKFSGKPTSVQG